MRRRVLSPGTWLTVGLILLAIVLGAFVYPSNDYLFLPDTAHPVAPLVSVPNGKHPAKGGIYFVDVVVKKASLLEKLFPSIHEGADLYPASAVNPPGTNDAQRERIDLQDMATSQQVAAAVAERADGLKVKITNIGVKVEDVIDGSPAVGKLEPDDVVTAVDGHRVTTTTELYDAMRKVAIGQTAAFTVTRGSQTLVERIKTVSSQQKHPRAVVGFFPSPATRIKVPIPVRIDAGGVGGPSAGLAFALEVLQELGRNVVHGHKVAATGEIFANGAVGPIGGIKQKTIGARRAHVDAFLVPAGENATDARKYAHGLKIIPVETFQQALHALATLR